MNPRVPLSTAEVYAGWDGEDRGPLGDWRDGRNDLEAAAIIRAKIKDVAISAGWTIAAEARNGKEAVERYAECRPTAVTVDLVMPEYDGMWAGMRPVGSCEDDFRPLPGSINAVVCVPAASRIVISAMEDEARNVRLVSRLDNITNGSSRIGRSIHAGCQPSLLVIKKKSRKIASVTY